MNAITRPLVCALAVWMSCFVGAATTQAVTATIGDALIDRSLDDSASGSIFVLPDLTFTGNLTQWTFFDNDNATPDRQVTPLIVEQTSATQYRIAGIGTTVTTNETGVQGPFSFGLVSGSSATGPGRFFAYKDGSNGADNVGVIDYDNNGGDFIRWTGGGHTAMAVNDVKTVQLNLGRTYSVQFTEQTTGVIVGDAPILRPNNDGAAGSIFVMPDALPAGKLAEWGFFDTTDAGQSVTPLILEQTGPGSYIVRGVGATRTSDGTGGQAFLFNLVSGTDVVGGNFFFGWRDGSTTGGNDGVIDYSDNGGDNIRWLGGFGGIGVGTTGSVAADLGRTYSVQVHVNAIIPEPATAMLGLFGLAGLALRRRQ